MIGIDIYGRYQTVNDWNAVRGAGVEFAWVKGTDGGGPARVRADAFVGGAKSVGIPVGLYHFAQKSPSAEAQADVLAGEVRRLGANSVAPALDLEDNPGTGLVWAPGEARDFGVRFLNRLRGHGFGRVAVYSSVSQLKRWDPDNWGIPGLIIWAARYGSNNGANQGLGGYGGRVDVHQFTSAGQVPGIVGLVDLNEAATNPTETEEDFLSALSHDEQRNLYNRVMGFMVQRWYLQEGDVLRPVAEGTPGALPARSLDTLDGNFLLGALPDRDADVVSAVRALSCGEGSLDALAAAILPILPAGTDPEAFAEALRRSAAASSTQVPQG
ncbi:glycoside hydrolase family 25 protein [Actinokineospora pegani]|uniref:glycoside hydrolase family 25 protein n=1 Tax=Actinokineospora pegani TaxID=2654637 RepID=UPI0012EAF983|nr:glycoside hydrolase family 25 protein [Actinokineospora pegani]